MKKFIARLALVGALASGALAVSSAPAHAGELWRLTGNVERGSSCAGRYYDGFNLYQQGRQIGAVFIYYSSANGGTYCAFTRNYSGGRPTMSIWIDGDGNNFALNYGQFSSYAGTVTIKNADFQCVTIRGQHGSKWASRRVGRCHDIPRWKHNIYPYDYEPRPPRR